MEKIKIKYTETTDRELEVELPYYTAYKMESGNTFAIYKIHGTEKDVIVNSIQVTDEVYKYSTDCIQNANHRNCIQVDEQRWAEALVKLKVQVDGLLKEYSI